MDGSPAVPGRRERSKLDKRRRISAAARAVFTEFGYERANMREIAKRASVATGTLFLYAPDKRNLLLWILNDDLDRVTTESFASLATVLPDGEFIDQLLHVFEARYRYWGTDPDLSLHALQELIVQREIDVTPESHLSNYHERRSEMLEHVTEVVRAQQGRGALDETIAPELLARLMMGIYNATLRTWLRSASPDVDAGLAELRLLLRLAVDGCAKTPARGAGGT